MLFMTEEQLIEHNRKYDIDISVLLPLVSSEVYMPQSVGEIIDIANRSDGRFIPFCNIDPRVLTNTSDAPIGNLLEFYKNQGCRGIGEVLPNLAWNDPRMQNLLHCVEEIGFPLLFDMTGNRDRGYGIYDDPGMPQLEMCLQKYPNLTFVGHGPAFWAEISELRRPEDRHSYPNYPVYKEGRVAKLLREYPNLWVELSAGSGANAMMRDREYAIGFLNEFKERVMFGTDTCYVGQPLHMTGFLKELRAQGHLTDADFHAIASGNAKKLLAL
jgi:predicted TIM-barrel fold metal-dependent hydrolase